MAGIPLAFYAHHHGSGHITRAIAIAKHIPNRVLLLSSRQPDHELPPNITFIKLLDDTVADYTEPTNSMYLYSPYADNVMDRYSQLIQIFKSYHVGHLYVDVSPEIIHFARLMGLTVGSAIMHGDRTDKAHTHAYNNADYLIAHMAKFYDQPTNRLHTKTPYYCGGICRFKRDEITQSTAFKNVLLISSKLSDGFNSKNIEILARAFPATNWVVAGPTVGNDTNNLTYLGLVNDLEQLINEADCVIGSGGNNLIMEIAAKAKPFLCVPESRPFDEQYIAAKQLETLNIALTLSQLPTPQQWQSALNNFAALDLHKFQSLVDDNAAKRAANFIFKQAS